MSTTESDSDSSYQSDDSDVNFIPGYVVIEDAEHEFSKLDVKDDSTDESVADMAYSEEPLADEEWLENYQKAESERLELEQKLCERFDGSVEISEW